jgi:hypothetical protein
MVDAEPADAVVWIGADGRPGLRLPLATRRPSTGPVAPRRARHLEPTLARDAATSRLVAASTPTGAGRFFLPPPVNPQWMPPGPASIFAVHVPLDRGGFRVAGRPVTPRMLAKAIRCCPEWRARPVLLVTLDGSGMQPPPGTLVAALATSLDVPVYSSDQGVYFGLRVVLTGGSFRRWSPA